MALNYKQKSPFIYVKFEHDGKHYFLATPFPKRPPGWETMTPEELKKANAALAQGARDFERMCKGAANGELNEEEFLDEMRLLFRRLRRLLNRTRIALFVVEWVWEQSIRNQPSLNRVDFVTSTIDKFLNQLKTLAHKVIASLNKKHLSHFVRSSRESNYSVTTVNMEVQLLQSLSRALKPHLGRTLAEDLEEAEAVYGKRKAFSKEELKTIIKALRKMGGVGQEWKTVILLVLYTSMRPETACLLLRSAINVTKRTITYKEGKTGKRVTRRIQRWLWKHLDPLVTNGGFSDSDPLSPTLYDKSRTGRSTQFRTIMEHAKISLTPVTLEYGKVRQMNLCLYALRKTFNVWQQALGRSKKQRKQFMQHYNDSAHEPYEDDEDPYVIEEEGKLLDMMPSVL